MGGMVTTGNLAFGNSLLETKTRRVGQRKQFDDDDALFKLLDLDGSGCVDIEEFCDGCMQLKGEAKSYDIKVLMHEVLSIQKSLARFMVEVDGRLSGLDSVYRSEGSPERDQSLFSLRSLSR